MELKDTIEMMTSEDYKERFRAEFYQVRTRREKHIDNFLYVCYNIENLRYEVRKWSFPTSR